MPPIKLTLALLVLLNAVALAQTTVQPETVTYKVRQTVTIDQIKSSAESLRMWVAIPSDCRDQDLFDLNVVKTPGPWRFVRDEEQGNRYLMIEAEPKGEESVEVIVDFVLRRRSRFEKLESEVKTKITKAQARMFAADLRRDEPHMEVSLAIELAADKVCGKETDVATQVKLLLEHVCGAADHYSKDSSKPSCGLGDARACVDNGGGCCTDLHSYFIALCRARGIPARLQMGYRLLAKNVGRDVDPGYRCWVEYFIPGKAWLAADLVEADAASGIERERWLSGLSARRLWLNQGRGFRLADDQAVDRVNHMSIAYAEIDGEPARLLPVGDLKPQIHRQIRFTEVDLATDNQEAVVEK